MSDPRGNPDELREFGFLRADGSPTIMWTVAGTDGYVMEPTVEDAYRRLANDVAEVDAYVEEPRGIQNVEPVHPDQVRNWDAVVLKRVGTPEEWASYLASDPEVAAAVEAEFERAEREGDFPDMTIEARFADERFGRTEQVERLPGVSSKDAVWHALGEASDLNRGWTERDVVRVTEAGPVLSVAADEDAKRARALARAGHGEPTSNVSRAASVEPRARTYGASERGGDLGR